MAHVIYDSTGFYHGLVSATMSSWGNDLRNISAYMVVANHMHHGS